MHATPSHRVLSHFWLVGAGLALALVWLLPNHTHPWLAFHSDAWAGLILGAVAVAVVVRGPVRFRWDWLAVCVAFLACMPFAQYRWGLGHYFGIAWMNSAYLLGLLLCLVIGAAWEGDSPGQTGDFLFLAIGLAGICSVGLQLHQWFALDPIGPWTLWSSGTRHFANMSQPNQLASLLLLGVLGCAWGFHRQRLSAGVATVVAALLLFGVVLTESRTAWVNVALLLAVTLGFGRAYLTRRFRVVAMGLAAYFFASMFVLPSLNATLGASGIPIAYRSAVGDLRIEIWSMFLRALELRPWLGYGWGQLAHAQWLMMESLPALGTNSLQAHNVVLDLLLWNGVPIGAALVAFGAWWCWRIASSIRSVTQWVQVSFLLVLATHAMLEYPHQYAYFLLPAGLVLGNLSTSMALPVAFVARRGWVAGLLAGSIAMLVVTIRDYARVEESFYGLRFEQRRIQTTIPKTPPDVLVLDQWHDYILFARNQPRAGLKQADLDWMRKLTMTIPSAQLMYKLAGNLAMNGQPKEARQWLRMVCKVNGTDQCEAVRQEWVRLGASNPDVAALAWPTP